MKFTPAALVVALSTMSFPALAVDWAGIVVTSNTLDLHAGRLCVGADPSVTTGCPTYAPSLTTAGDVSVTGNLSAAKFYGDGSALTGISTGTPDRITSGTTSVLANNAGPISFTTAGTTAMVISGSNVGIGTSSPSYPLHVSGSSMQIGTSNGTYANIYTPSGGLRLAPYTGQIWFGITGAAGMSDAITLGLASNSGLKWSNAANNFYSAAQDVGIARSAAGALKITNAGSGLGALHSSQIGIGITAPARTLDVSGTTRITSNTEVVGIISATEVKVSSTGQACTADNVGTLRWNTAKNRPEMCFPATP